MPLSGGEMPASVGGREPGFVPGRLLVAVLPGAGPAAGILEGLPVVGEVEGQSVYLVEVPQGSEATMARWLEHRPEVRYAERDLYAYQLLLPNDRYYRGYQWNLSKIGAEDAWSKTTGSDQVVIAVLDAGIDPNHPDLRGKVLPGFSFVSGDDNIQDGTGHGTHIAGLAAAIGNNTVGIAGVNWKARILPIKVLDGEGTGTDSWIASGVRKAAQQGARVINLSLGSPGYNQTLRDAIDYARAQGCLVVAAAGNDYERGNPTMYPAAYLGVMGVGATTSDDLRASYSQTGFWVSVVAPGGDPTGSRDPDPKHWIYSDWPLALSDGYRQAAGTSQAVPLVSGLAALLWSVDPSLSAAKVRSVIESTAADLGAPGRDDWYGFGRINAGAAVAKVAVIPDTTPPTLALLSPTSGSYVSHVVAVSGTATDEHLAGYNLQYASASAPGAWADVLPGGVTPVPVGRLGNWETTAVPDGRYLLRVSASDQAGNVKVTPPVSITVDNTPPVLRIEHPVDGEMVGDVVPVRGAVEEANGRRLYLELGAGEDPITFGYLQGTEKSAPWSDLLGTANLASWPEGAYALRVVVEDRAGNSTTRTVRVTLSRTPVPAPLPGDVDGDGRLGLGDVLLALRYVAGLAALTPAGLRAGDVVPSPGVGGRAYGDGRLGMDDAITILREVAGLAVVGWPSTASP
jgi:hypothetical protein